MKKIFIILLIVMANTVQGQISDTAKTVSVNGSAPLVKTIEKYRIKATLSMDQLYYADSRIENLTQLKKQYFGLLAEKGVDTATFIEKEIEYFSLGYQREGTILYYETTSEDIAMKLAKTNFQGVTIQFQVKQNVSPENNQKALEIALADAKKNAQLLCSKIGNHLGEIMTIRSSQHNNNTWISYYSDYDEQFTVNITYSMN